MVRRSRWRRGGRLRGGISVRSGFAVGDGVGGPVRLQGLGDDGPDGTVGGLGVGVQPRAQGLGRAVRDGACAVDVRACDASSSSADSHTWRCGCGSVDVTPGRTAWASGWSR